jgi:hypothetical protein
MPPTLYSIIAGFFVANLLIFMSGNIFVWLSANTSSNVPGTNQSKISLLNQTFGNLTISFNQYLSSLNTSIVNSAAGYSQLSIVGSLAFTLAEMPKVVSLILQLPQFNITLLNALISVSGLDVYIPGIHILVSLLYMFMWFVMLLFIASVLTKYNWTGG